MSAPKTPEPGETMSTSQQALKDATVAQDEARAWDAYAAAGIAVAELGIFATRRDSEAAQIADFADAMLEQRRKRFGGGK